MPLNQIVSHVQLQKELCKGVPFYVLGPIVTDIARDTTTLPLPSVGLSPLQQGRIFSVT